MPLYEKILILAMAGLPVVIWAILLFRGRKTSRRTFLAAFALGALAVIPLMGLQYVWIFFPQLHLQAWLPAHMNPVTMAFLLTVVFAMVEEVVKGMMLYVIDRSKVGIQTINDAVGYSILIGLGFSFVENITYFFVIAQFTGLSGLLPVVIFRSIFTMCGHMSFSGIFGYYYGISKFSKPLLETKLWKREKAYGIRILSKILSLHEAIAFRKYMLLKGLACAMLIHAFFNGLLQVEQFLAAILLVGAGLIFLLYLLAHRSGALVFANSSRPSSMLKKDQDVVLELLGMWSKEGRYQDVIDICQRLLVRDPDNKVVQLFLAEALEAEKLQDLESSVKALFGKSKEEQQSLRTLLKQKILMDLLKTKNPIPAQVLSSPSEHKNPSSRTNNLESTLPRVPRPNNGERGVE